MIGNYYVYVSKEDQNFMDHQSHYKIIVTIQAIDIILNFFRLDLNQK